MKKFILLFVILFIFLIGCSSQNSQTSTEHSSIVNWAKKIVEIEAEYLEVTDDFNILQRKLVSNYATNEDLAELEVIFETISGFYTKANRMSPPSSASTVHLKYTEKYSLASDAMLQYFIAVSQNDISYYEKSRYTKEANRIGNEAYDEFIELLNEYSITCDEINFCE